SIPVGAARPGAPGRQPELRFRMARVGRTASGLRGASPAGYRGRRARDRVDPPSGRMIPGVVLTVFGIVLSIVALRWARQRAEIGLRVGGGIVVAFGSGPSCIFGTSIADAARLRSSTASPGSLRPKPRR